jgi:predicted kinase
LLSQPGTWARYPLQLALATDRHDSSSCCAPWLPRDHDRPMDVRVFVSGAPGTGKTTVAAELARQLQVPMLSLDVIKEALGDSLGLGDQRWSDHVGDAAAEALFRLAASFPSVVAEGWWRRERRERAMREFAGWVEVFCRCDPEVAAQRMRARAADARHPIHRYVSNPAILDGVADVVASTTALRVTGGSLVEVDTTAHRNESEAVAAIRAALGA